MSTWRKSILGHSLRLNSTDGNFIEGSDVKDVNDVFKNSVIVLNDTGTKIGFYGSFDVPGDYVGGAKFIIKYKTTATSGDFENDIDYSSIATGESGDPAAAQESLNQNDTVPGTARIIAENELTATAGNFAANDICKYAVWRDNTDGGDTVSAAQIIEDVLFEYTDA